MGFTGDFKISRRFRKISGFHVRFQDFTIDFGISREISRFHYRFQDFTEDFKISRFHERFQDFKKDFTRSVRDFSEWRTPRIIASDPHIINIGQRLMKSLPLS